MDSTVTQAPAAVARKHCAATMAGAATGRHSTGPTDSELFSICDGFAIHLQVVNELPAGDSLVELW